MTRLLGCLLFVSLLLAAAGCPAPAPKSNNDDVPKFVDPPKDGNKDGKQPGKKGPPIG